MRTKAMLTAAIILISFWAGTVFSQDVDEQQAILENCPKNMPTTFMSGCVAEIKLQATEVKLAAAIENLQRKHTSAQEREYFERAQKAWINFREESCKYEDHYWAGGTALGTNMLLCRRNYNLKRIAVIGSYPQY